MTKQTATLMGLGSILIWASLVAVVKLLTEALTPLSALALIYSFSAICIVASSGFPQVAQMPKAYLYGCGALFICYEVLFLSSVALSRHRDEVLIIAMLNYLWPPLTVLFAIFAGQLRHQNGVIIGFVLSIVGLMLVVNPHIFDVQHFRRVLLANPMAYGFAFIAAILWANYSVLTKKYAQGHNAVSLFFALTACSLWVIFAFSDEHWQMPTAMLWLAVAAVGGLIGWAYQQWNQSLQFGNMKVLILATYFMPILSSMMSMFILQITVGWIFWLGTLLVTMGALICWKSTEDISVNL